MAQNTTIKKLSAVIPVAAGAATVMATAAEAAPVKSQELTVRTFDDLSIALGDKPLVFDFDGDGKMDFKLSIGLSKKKTGFNVDEKLMTKSPIFEDVERGRIESLHPGASILAERKTKFALGLRPSDSVDGENDDDLIMFATSAVVDDSKVDVPLDKPKPRMKPRSYKSSSTLYWGDKGPLATIGSSILVGLRVERPVVPEDIGDSALDLDPIGIIGYPGVCEEDFARPVTEPDLGGILEVAKCLPCPEVSALHEGDIIGDPVKCLIEPPTKIKTETVFGWAEITRGSLSLGSVTTAPPGVAAVVPAVPLPPGLALLATGAVGLAAMRRRKKAAQA